MGEMMARGIPFWVIVKFSPVVWALLSNVWMVSGRSERIIAVMMVSGLSG